MSTNVICFILRVCVLDPGKFTGWPVASGGISCEEPVRGAAELPSHSRLCQPGPQLRDVACWAGRPSAGSGMNSTVQEGGAPMGAGPADGAGAVGGAVRGGLQSSRLAAGHIIVAERVCTAL